MHPSPSLASRAVLAVVLLFGFYLLAAAIVVGLLYLPYAEWQFAGRLHIKLLLFAVIGAGAIVIAVFPRRERFTPPGPRLDLEKHPRLDALVRRVAEATGQEVPKEIYVVPDVNAFVGQRGGVLGFGSTRIMGLGLPLMSHLTVSQFAAVLAHEFGHYHGGDTALGPWIYRTRQAIGRTLLSLEERTFLQLPFRAYGHLFLKVTQSISRAQEYSADALVARVVGGAPLASGLRAIHAASLGFGSYWQHELVPVINSGYRVPVRTGFDTFMRSPRVAGALEQAVEAEIATGTADPFDSHPSLRERLAAITSDGVAAGWEGDDAAITLLDDVDAVEASLLAFLVGEQTVATLPVIGWDDVPHNVWIPLWRHIVAENARRLHGLTPGTLATLDPHPSSLAVAMQLAAGPAVATEEHTDAADRVFGAGLATALVDRGWSLRARPGDVPVVATDGVELRPFHVWPELCDGTLDREAWQRLVEKHGLADLELVASGTTTAPEAAG